MKLRSGIVLTVVAAGAAGLIWLTPAAGRPSVRLQARPAVGEAPTEVIEEQDEEEGHRARDEWIEIAHRAPDGVDWREIEADNVRKLIERHRSGDRAAPVGAWVERGSDDQAGSMYSVVRSTDGASIVAGASMGGVWRGTRAGEDWTPHGDGIYGGVHHLAVLPPDVAGGPDVLLTLPTWENLVYRSNDDGVTWTSPAGLSSNLIGVRRIAVGTDGTVWLVGVLSSTGVVYRSTDAGRTFENVLDLGGVWGDVFVPRVGNGAVYALGSRLFVSTDNGESWDQESTPASLSIARLGGSEATSPPRLYVSTGDSYGYDPSALYVSDNGGVDWTSRGALEDDWDLLTVSIRNPDLVAYGGVDLYRSTDGGQQFRAVNTWDEYYGDPLNKLHADMMAVGVVPDEPGGETWYIGCHGGVYESVDGLQRVRNLSLSGLRVSQYYSSLTSSEDPSQILAGAQDQGLQYADGAPVQGTERFGFEQVLSGDYGHLVAQGGSHDWVFSVYPGFLLVWRGTPEPQLDYLDFPPDPAGAPWLPYLTADPNEKDAVFFAGSKLWHYSHTDDDQWDVTAFSDQDFSVSNGEFLSAFEFSPIDPTLAWAVTSNGRVFRSVDGAATWNETDQGPIGNWYYGAALAPSRRDPGLVYLGGSGYDGPSVYRSTNGGRAFEAWDQGLPPTLVYTLIEARDGTGRVLAGTENAVYLREPEGDTWVDVTGTAPITQYWSAEVLTSENTVRFSTYGRGLWDYRLTPQGEGCFPTVDGDLDGAFCEHDCDDADPTALPGGTEVCDGIDNDCDGIAEPDADGDGAFVCDEGPTDCDDAEPLAAPGLEEIQCDGIDNDCVDGDVCELPDLEALTDGGGCGCASTGMPSGMFLAIAVLVSTSSRSRTRRRTARPGR